MDTVARSIYLLSTQTEFICKQAFQFINVRVNYFVSSHSIQYVHFITVCCRKMFSVIEKSSFKMKSHGVLRFHVATMWFGFRNPWKLNALLHTRQLQCETWSSEWLRRAIGKRMRSFNCTIEMTTANSSCLSILLSHRIHVSSCHTN